MSESVFPDARPFPVNLRLAGKAVLVVGAGLVAHRKIGQLLEAGANVTAVGPEVHPALEQLASEPLPVGSLTLERRRYTSGEVGAYLLAVTCTDDPAVNSRVHKDGIASGVWVNSADDPENCEFTLASVVRQGDLQITISTEGRSPALAMWLRKKFEREFTAEWAELLDLLSDVRDEARHELGTSEIHGWIEALDAGVPELVAQGEHDAARQVLREHLGLSKAATELKASA